MSFTGQGNCHIIAACAAEQLNNVLACLEHGLELSDSHPVDSEAVTNGLRTILGACRLVSLRIEQFIDLPGEVIDKKTEEIPLHLQDYVKIKPDYEDCILLYQLGDFYEMFWEDAEDASEILGLILTTRKRKSAPEQKPMCGFPVHSATAHLTKLIKAGRKVAVCDQVKGANGVLVHQVSRVISPGEEFLDSSKV